jgi:hypothetical protein
MQYLAVRYCDNVYISDVVMARFQAISSENTKLVNAKLAWLTYRSDGAEKVPDVTICPVSE